MGIRVEPAGRSVIATGIIAWQLQLEGQKLKGNLLLHLVLGSLSGALIWLVWWLHFRPRRQNDEPSAYRFAIEAVALPCGHGDPLT